MSSLTPKDFTDLEHAIVFLTVRFLRQKPLVFDTSRRRLGYPGDRLQQGVGVERAKRQRACSLY